MPKIPIKCLSGSLFLHDLKVCRCIYTHFDVRKIYKSLKSWSAFSLNLNKKTRWVIGVMRHRVLPLLNFQHWSYDYFCTKSISHSDLAIWWWRSSKVSSRSVFVFPCHVIILNNNYSWIFILFWKITDLLTIFVTFTWFYKAENIVMQQIEIDFGSHQTSWNISSAILKIFFILKAWLNFYYVITKFSVIWCMFLIG